MHLSQPAEMRSVFFELPAPMLNVVRALTGDLCASSRCVVFSVWNFGGHAKCRARKFSIGFKAAAPKMSSPTHHEISASDQSSTLRSPQCVRPLYKYGIQYLLFASIGSSATEANVLELFLLLAEVDRVAQGHAARCTSGSPLSYRLGIVRLEEVRWM